MPGTTSAQSRSEIVSLLEPDFSEIASFIASQSGRAKDAVEEHLRWFLLGNPARRAQYPLGFGLRADDQLAGCILLVPQFFHFNTERILFLGSSSFYVDAGYRGQGGRIFLQYCRQARSAPLFGTSANADAAALWKAAGASPIPGSAGELFGIVNWPPLAEEFVHRRYSSPLLTRLAGSPLLQVTRGVGRLKLAGNARDLRLLTCAEQVEALRIHDSPGKITALRDSAYIRWRYFSGADSSTAAFAFYAAGLDREVLVTVNRRSRGHRGQIRTLNILDVYPEMPAEAWERIVGALMDYYRHEVDAVVLRYLNREVEKMFIERGFKPRVFDSANGWFLDKRKVLAGKEWYIVAADGDGLI